jgi:hypothetical protein
VYIVSVLFIQNSINILILLALYCSFTYKTCFLGSLINLVEILALVILPAHFLLLVDVWQEVADVLELCALGRHARPRRLGAQPLVPGVANVERPGGGAPLKGFLGRRLGRLGLPLRRRDCYFRLRPAERVPAGLQVRCCEEGFFIPESVAVLCKINVIFQHLFNLTSSFYVFTSPELCFNVFSSRKWFYSVYITN